jgi:hypothetical protein
MTHRELCIEVAKYFIETSWCQLMGWEISYNYGYADVVGITLRDKDPHKRIAVAEVKRTRADLLQDLNKGKLLKYEKGTSHCYLAATPEALRLDKVTEAACLEELTKLGLPKSWGVLVIDQGVRSIRSARQINKVNLLRTRALTKRLARSHMYRMLNGNSTGGSVPDPEEEC